TGASTTEGTTEGPPGTGDDSTAAPTSSATADSTSTTAPASTSEPGTTSDPTTTGEPGPLIELPPPDGEFDYQLGGAYEPPAGVQIVSRDRHDPPAPGLYNICYVNGFQSQPGEDNFWLDDHPDLVLRDGKGDPVID